MIMAVPRGASTIMPTIARSASLTVFCRSIRPIGVRLGGGRGLFISGSHGTLFRILVGIVREVRADGAGTRSGGSCADLFVAVV